jgi:cell division protein ZapB
MYNSSQDEKYTELYKLECNYYQSMSEQTTDIRLKQQIGQLEQQLGEVLILLESLSQENTTLKSREAQLLRERSELHSKNDKVRTQVESMIHRLKNMDNA